jgi:hypothetical protein
MFYLSVNELEIYLALQLFFKIDVRYRFAY